MAVASVRLRRGRAPGFLNVAGALVGFILVMVVALRASQVSPPAIAEFAPQPQHPISQAPSEQTSSLGHGQGGAGAGLPSPSPSPAAQPLPANAVYLHCVGDPPRQTEDPQSPPCVAYWQGANGGATYKGVSKSSIYVGFPDY